jgi:hypothetical protein
LRGKEGKRVVGRIEESRDLIGIEGRGGGEGRVIIEKIEERRGGKSWGGEGELEELKKR